MVALTAAAIFAGSFAVAGDIGAYSLWGYQYGQYDQYDQYGGAQYTPQYTPQYTLRNDAGDETQYDSSGGEHLTMDASYYGYELAGAPTASGEPFNPEGYTAAHKTLPFGTQLQVSYGGNTVGVTVNDRGPYVAGRELDLSQGAAEAIGLTSVGAAPVEVTVLN